MEAVEKFSLDDGRIRIDERCERFLMS